MTSAASATDSPKLRGVTDVSTGVMHVDQILLETDQEPAQAVGRRSTPNQTAQWGPGYVPGVDYGTNVLGATSATIMLSTNMTFSNISASLGVLGYVHYDVVSGNLTHGTRSLAEELAQGPPPTSWIATSSLFV